MQSVLGKAHARNQELTQAYQREMFRLPTDMPWWSAGLAVRTALQALADTLARCLPPVVMSFKVPLYADAAHSVHAFMPSFTGFSKFLTKSLAS